MTETAQIEKTDHKTATPRKWGVYFLNDDVTPMDYVVSVLMRIYHHDESSAYKIMMTVHNDGYSLVGTYPFDVAETKVEMTVSDSRDHGFSLKVETREIE